MDDGGNQIDGAYLHARDSDTILGDNGNIFRLVGIEGTDSGSLLTFNYDDYTDSLPESERMHIVVRAAQLLDYPQGGPDRTPTPDDDDSGADIIQEDIEASNGIAHIIDAVMGLY